MKTLRPNNTSINTNPRSQRQTISETGVNMADFSIVEEEKKNGPSGKFSLIKCKEINQLDVC